METVAQSKRWAGSIAAANLVIAYLTILLPVFLTVMWLAYKDDVVKSLDQHWKIDVSREGVTIGVIWFTLVVIALFTLLKLWTAHLLWNGTQQESDTKTCVRCCRIWKIVTIVCLVFQVLLIFGSGVGFIIATIVIAVMSIRDLVFLYFVQCYTSDLVLFQIFVNERSSLIE